MERVGGRWEKMEGHCSTGQSPQWAVVPMEEEDQPVSEYAYYANTITSDAVNMLYAEQQENQLY